MYIKNCDWCGGKFETKFKNGRFCCQKCLSKFHEKHRKKRCYKTICANCGKEIIRSRNITEKEPLRFCNSKCASEYRSKNNQIQHCVICGKEFIPNKTNHKCCSRQCKDMYMFYKKERTCVVCGKIYHSYTFGKTCSQECNHILRSQNTIHNFTIGKYPTSLTKQHKIINSLLDKLKIKYINEKSYSYYSIDIYLQDYNLCIEIMGGYWHLDYRRFDKNTNFISQQNAIEKDKRKKKYIEEKYSTKILYLWEKEVNENLELCEKLILEFIENPYNLKDFHSSSYKLNGDKIELKKSYKKQYMERRKYIKKKNTLND